MSKTTASLGNPRSQTQLMASPASQKMAGMETTKWGLLLGTLSRKPPKKDVNKIQSIGSQFFRIKAVRNPV